MPSVSLAETRLAERAVPGLHGAVLRFVTRTFPPHTSILDCGAGTGAWAASLAERGYTNLHAIDLDATSYGAAAPFSAVDLNSRFADEVFTVFGRRPYDLITAIEVIEHLENPSQFLRQCRELLSPKGTLLVTSPNPECAPARFTLLVSGRLRHFDGYGDPTHITPVFPSILERIARANGFDLVDVRPVPDGSSFSSHFLWKRLFARSAALVAGGHPRGDCNLFVLKPRP